MPLIGFLCNLCECVWVYKHGCNSIIWKEVRFCQFTMNYVNWLSSFIKLYVCQIFRIQSQIFHQQHESSGFFFSPTFRPLFDRTNDISSKSRHTLNLSLYVLFINERSVQRVPGTINLLNPLVIVDYYRYCCYHLMLLLTTKH